jgi:hypothetical protein
MCYATNDSAVAEPDVFCPLSKAHRRVGGGVAVSYAVTAIIRVPPHLHM